MLLFGQTAVDLGPASELFKSIGSQGPYATILAVLAWVFIRYWILPKAEADIAKVKSDAVANQQQAEALKTIAHAYDEMSRSIREIGERHNASHRDMRRMISFVSQGLSALSINNDAGVKSALQGLQALAEE
jgi:hypothetical protein